MAKETITYQELAERLDELKLFNKAPELDIDIWSGLENGSLYPDCDAEYVGGKYYCRDHDCDMPEVTPEDFDTNASLRCDEAEENFEDWKEIFQWYLISAGDANYLKNNTEELVFYSHILDEYVWGVTHFGTAWSGVELEFGR